MLKKEDRERGRHEIPGLPAVKEIIRLGPIGDMPRLISGYDPRANVPVFDEEGKRTRS